MRLSGWTLIFPSQKSHSDRLLVAGGDDFCPFRQVIHCIDPRLNSRTIRQAEICQNTIVEAGISLQTVDIRPVPDRDLYQFDCDLRFSIRDKCRESPPRVIERPGNCCASAENGIPAETIIPFAGTECAVCGAQDSFFFHLRRSCFLSVRRPYRPVYSASNAMVFVDSQYFAKEEAIIAWTYFVDF